MTALIFHLYFQMSVSPFFRILNALYTFTNYYKNSMMVNLCFTDPACISIGDGCYLAEQSCKR